MSEYYSDIEDFSMYNWRKIQEKGLIKYTRKDIENGTLKQDRQYWVKIQDSFLDEFGLSKDQARIIELQIEIAELECDLVIEDDAFLENKIRHLNTDIKEIRDRGTGGDLDDTIHYLETWRKIEINEKTTSVRKFYKMYRTYTKEAEQRKTQK